MKSGAAFLVMLALVFSGCSAPAKPPKVDPAPFITTGNAFLKTLMQGKYQEAYVKYISPSAKFMPQFSQQQFTADWQAIVEKYGILKKAVLKQYQVFPNHAVVQLYYAVTQEKGGKNFDITYHLVAESDPQGRCTVFLIDVGNVQAYPAGGQGGEKKTPEQAVEILP